MPKRSDDSLDTAWIDAFLAVIDHGTYEDAAIALGCGQSTISNRVAKLEGWLGGLLFSREGPTRLTNLGVAFAEASTEALDKLKRFRQAAHIGAAPDEVPDEPEAVPLSKPKSWWARTFGKEKDFASELDVTFDPPRLRDLATVRKKRVRRTAEVTDMPPSPLQRK